MLDVSEREKEGTGRAWSYVTLKKIKEGHTWTIGCAIDTSYEELRAAKERVLSVHEELRDYFEERES